MARRHREGRHSEALNRRRPGGIDKHYRHYPDIVSPDTKRYPLAPLGGKAVRCCRPGSGGCTGTTAGE